MIKTIPKVPDTHSINEDSHGETARQSAASDEERGGGGGAFFAYGMMQQQPPPPVVEAFNQNNDGSIGEFMNNANPAAAAGVSASALQIN